MALGRGIEENHKQQQVTIGFLFLISEAVLFSTRAMYEVVQVVLQGMNIRHVLFTMAEIM